MTIFNQAITADFERLLPLVDSGDIDRESLAQACSDAAHRKQDVESILRHEYLIPRLKILKTLAQYYNCHWIEYDERLPVPPELLAGLDPVILCTSHWFPIIKEGKTVVIAAKDPSEPRIQKEIRKYVPADNYEFRVALGEDIRNFIQDFLNSVPEHIIGNERTGLAYWRNTMARWRTRLACYRTDFAKARTHLSLLRWGFGLIGLGRALLHVQNLSYIPYDWVMIASGAIIIILGLSTYLRTKTSVLHPPKHQTLIEVTGACLYFLEGYQFAELKPKDTTPKRTMLARLGDSLPNFCVFIEPSLDNKVRSSLAHERTSLAGQRTVFGCYRTIYARARTGLAFIRTGVTFVSIGLGFIEYFGLSLLTILDSALVITGLLMIIDGAIWYWPARKEQGEAAKYTPLV
jgi:uncharacterized membrane protein YidH (DUF202 family)